MASLFSGVAWTSGTLDDYLGLVASPNNPIGAFLPATQAVDAGATGFDVYQADLGTNRLQGNSGALSGPLLSIGSALPTGSYLVGFLLDSPDSKTPWAATANSGAILELGAPKDPVPTPEPASLGLLAAGLAGLGLIGRSRTRRERTKGQAGA